MPFKISLFIPFCTNHQKMTYFVFSLCGYGQKWHCVEEITGKWRIQKCKGGSKESSRKRARSLKPRSGYDNRERGCDCREPSFKPSKVERRSHRQLSSGQRECAHICCMGFSVILEESKRAWWSYVVSNSTFFEIKAEFK